MVTVPLKNKLKHSQAIELNNLIHIIFVNTLHCSTLFGL